MPHIVWDPSQAAYTFTGEPIDPDLDRLMELQANTRRIAPRD